MRTSGLTVLLALCLLSTGVIPSKAGDIPELRLGPNHVPLSTRIFDIGQEPRDYYTEEGFIPLDRIKWLQSLIAGDPLFEHGVFHLKRHPSPSAEFLWKDPIWGGRAPLPNPPSDFAHPDYNHSAKPDFPPFSVLLTQKADAPDHAVCCGKDPTTLIVHLCTVLASYPPDPRLFLRLRIYGHGPVPDRQHTYADIAQRMREIVYCLDVTEDIDPDGPSRFDGQNFKTIDEYLTFCRKAQIS